MERDAAQETKNLSKAYTPLLGRFGLSKVGSGIGSGQKFSNKLLKTVNKSQDTKQQA